MTGENGKWSVAARGGRRLGGFVRGVDVFPRGRAGCRCKPGATEPCGACQQAMDAEEDRELWDEPPHNWEP